MEGTVLLIDYSSYERQKYKHILEKIGSFEIIEVLSLNQFKLLDVDMMDLMLVLIDICLPSESQGFEVLQLLREKRPGVPVIIITNSDKREHKLEALKYSVKDYIVKPYQVKRLENSIRSLSGAKESFSYDTAGMGEIRLSFDEYVAREIKYSNRTQTPLSFILITALKLNGSPSGGIGQDFPDRETVFRTLAEKTRSVLRETDTIVVSRGKDIIVVLPGTGEEDAVLVSGKIIDTAFEELKISGVAEVNRIYSVCVTYPKDGEDFQALMATAFKKVSDKEMLEKIVSIPSEKRKYADKSYNRYNRLF